MRGIEVSWPGVALVAVVFAAAIAAASVTGDGELARMLATLGAGLLVPAPLRGSK